MADNLVRLFVLEDILDDLLEAVEQRTMKINRRFLRDTFDPFSVSENNFFSLYRLSKEAARVLIDTLQPHLPQTTRTTAIPTWMKVLATLDFFASGSYQRRVGQDYMHAMCQTSVSHAMKNVIVEMNRHLLNQWVTFPTTPDAIQQVKENFMASTHFPGVRGCVDGTHIAIVPPLRVREHLFLNRKNYHSRNVQVICDSDLRIIAMNARHGGRSHDAHIWRLSAVRAELQRAFAAEDRGSWLLGDSGYPSEPWLLRPFANSPERDTPRGRFNARLCSARSTVERTIGVFKARFRCCRKDRVLHYTPEVAGLIINACAIVHNMAIHYRVPNPAPIFDDIDLPRNAVAIVDAPNQRNADVHADGIAVRARVVREHFRQ